MRGGGGWIVEVIEGDEAVILLADHFYLPSHTFK